MKKWTALMMALVMVCAMGISGCGNSGGSGNAAETGTAAESAVETGTAAESAAETGTAAETTAAETAAETGTTAETAAESSAADETADESAEAAAETGESGESASQAETQPALEPVDDPDFSAGLDDDGNLIDKTLTEAVKLPDYKNAEFTEADVTVTEDEVISQIESLMAPYVTQKQVTDREVKDGDTVNIDYVGSVDGVEFEGGNTNGAGTNVTIGVTSYIDDFLEQLIGHKPGDTFDVNVTFPDSYPQNTDLQGKDAVFVTTINYISENETPERTDEFVSEHFKEQYNCTTAAEMDKAVEDELRRQKEYGVVWKWLLDASEMEEVPESLVNTQLDIYEQYMRKSAYNSGVTLETYLAAYGQGTVDDLREGYKSSAEQTAKQYVINQAISDAESLTVTEEEIDKFFGATDAETYKDFYGLGYIKFNMKMNKVVELIMENAALK